MAATDDYKIEPAAFPAATKSQSSTIGGHPTTATTLYFADKILITVTQHGRLAHWVRTIHCVIVNVPVLFF